MTSAPFPSPDKAPKSLRILAAADHYETGCWLTAFLKDLGHSVAFVSSEAEALNLLAENGFDVLISDVLLPDGNGWQLLKNARRQQDIYAIALSGSDWSGERAKSAAAGFRQHLLKPVRFSELQLALQDAGSELLTAG